MRRLKMLGVLIAAGLLAAACGTSSSPSSGKSAGPSGTLTLSNEQGALWTCSFNPFNPSNLSEGVTMGQVYEPLAFVAHVRVISAAVVGRRPGQHAQLFGLRVPEPGVPASWRLKYVRSARFARSRAPAGCG